MQVLTQCSLRWDLGCHTPNTLSGAASPQVTIYIVRVESFDLLRDRLLYMAPLKHSLELEGEAPC